MPKALIVYASMTGNTKTGSDIIEDKLKELGVEVQAKNCTEAKPEDFSDVDICVVGTYTYGEDADLPDEIIDFYEGLAQVNLKGKVFGVFGSGDTYYDKYCKSVDDFEEQFLKTGATKGSESVKFDLRPDMRDLEQLHKFAESLIWWQKRMI